MWLSDPCRRGGKLPPGLAALPPYDKAEIDKLLK